jgi:hypothetical protein
MWLLYDVLFAVVARAPILYLKASNFVFHGNFEPTFARLQDFNFFG